MKSPIHLRLPSASGTPSVNRSHLATFSAARLLGVLAGSLIVMGVTARASASCVPAKTASTYNSGSGQYAYWIQPSGYPTNQATLRGRFWQLGNRAAGNEGTCTTASCGPSGFGLFYFLPGGIGMNLNLGSPEVFRCPTGRLITVAENISGDGSNAAFLVGTADETPAGVLNWDYSVFGNRNLVPIPAPHITSSTTLGTNVILDFAVDSAALHPFAALWEALPEGAIGLEFVPQTAEEPAALAGDLGGIECQVLFLGHFYRYWLEVAEKGGAAKFPAADPHSPHQFRFVADADLAHLDSGMKGVG